MVWHSIDGHNLLLLVLNDASHVFVDLILVVVRNERLPALDCKDGLNINLGICVRQVAPVVIDR